VCEFYGYVHTYSSTEWSRWDFEYLEYGETFPVSWTRDVARRGLFRRVMTRRESL
jgi:hypothetical protein